MALAEANIKAIITAKDEASAVLSKFGDNASNVAGAASAAFLGATAAVTAFAISSVKAYSEHQAQMAQVNQVLQTTGKVAQISAAQVEALSMQMENYSGKSHDAIAAGQTLLLQFSQVTSTNLPQMTKAMLDLSQRMGVDTVTAAKQLGIALDSPTTGMARLRRSGIDFTESQKTAIKALQDSGDIAGADALLMQGLEQKVGGAAGAFRNTLSGAVADAKNKLHDFQEELGGKVVTALTNAYQWYEKHRRILNDILGVVGTLTAELTVMLLLYGSWVTVTKALTLAQAAFNAVFLDNPIIGAIAAIIAIGLLLIEHWQVVSKTAERLWHDTSTFFQRMWQDVSGFAERMWHDVDTFYQRMYNDGVTWATRIWHDVTDPFVRLWQDVVRIYQEGWERITLDILDFDKKSVLAWYHLLDGWWQTILAWTKTLPDKLWQAYDTSIWQPTVRWIETIPLKLYKQLDLWWQAFDSWVKSIPGKIETDLDLWWQAMLRWMKAIPGKVKAQLEVWKIEIENWFKSLPGRLEATLKKSFEDMANGNMDSFKRVWKDSKKVAEIAAIVLAALIAIPVIIAASIAVEFINLGIKVVGWIITGISLAIGGLLHLAGSIGGMVLGAVGAAGTWLYQTGKDIILGLIRGIGDAIGGIGGVIGHIGSDIGKSVSGALHSIHIPGFAGGVSNFSGGLAVVGEQGPELVNLPGGSSVTPNSSIGNSSPPINVSFNGIFTGNEMEFRKLAIKVFQAASDAASMQNKDLSAMTTQKWSRA